MSATTVKANKGQPCRCGCGGVTRGGAWLPGHDSKRRSALLRRFDGDSRSAGEELIRLGWYDKEQLRIRPTTRRVKALRPEDL